MGPHLHIFDGVSEVFKGDVLVDHGIIVEIGEDIKGSKDTVVVDLKGHILTPGIVDMHNHVGVFSWPTLSATNDFNEMSNPTVPFVRSIDGFNPSDVAREWIVSGGVTSTLVLPGSGNVIGGEAFAFKLRKVDTLSTEDMQIEAGVEEKWRYMKMACGENAKNNYGRRGQMPSTRLGEGWVFREQFAKATELKRAQDDWCNAIERLPRFGRYRLSIPFPEDPQYESLIGILRGDVKLNIHCYETHDIEAMVRHSNEFKFKIAAFHHGLDAYRIPDILKRAYKGVPVIATFAGKFGYKKEAFQSSVNSPKILVDAGISVAMKSDHPILNSQHLIYQASMARHYGLTELQALASVTSVPAKAIGQDHRIGKIAVGMDADLVVWERHPLSLGSHPLQVYIDGIAQIKDADPSQWSHQSEPLRFREYLDLAVPKAKDACTDKAEDGIFTVIKKIILENVEEVSSNNSLSVVAKGGRVICIGHCGEHVAAAEKEGIPMYDLGGEGVVLPSFISVGTPYLGLLEIPPESSTGDGYSNLNPEILHAADALKFGGLHMDEAYKAGVLIGVTAPVSQHVIQGSALHSVLALKMDAVLKKDVALHVRLGQASKSRLFPTVSSQIAFLRSSLEKGLLNLFNPSHEFARVVKGNLPLVVEVHNRDEIVRLIQIKKELEHQGAKIKLSLLGATEAWTVAEHLAEADIGVILRPYHCTPHQWTAQRCLPGAPLSKGTGLSALYGAGVTVGLAAEEFEDIRHILWMAAWARSDLVSAIIGGGKSGIHCNPRAF
ncbi:hypothetical protein BCR41DRAFT_381221 [Lobosporangium transversale]|uniref:Amidohydrolase-related domain-containing protein n=1 Tax=Lobosporangium transversale TaxID=64571 RepID=A0A1Y2GK42_9FUNG|nr:hypothetical protein BCR41DRAFT_381221 [Lobosporangium transversale]ORZ13347.1 hypothetical protein BCR41DRAFT_381221 [Lobosporangium transversale]|eukprot:XP_021880428.1 hypothetical protein BCR41DRAFT_381221 [Lobosporangium transversale]